MFENIRNFLKKRKLKNINKQLVYIEITTQRHLVGEEIYYEEYAINAIKADIKRNIEQFIEIHKSINEKGNIDITGKIKIYGNKT